jgi:hypothetical protein
MSVVKSKTGIVYLLLGLIGLGLIIYTYFTPMWWVALQSHQYPKSMYPKGIRIEFKYNGVYNGCQGVRERAELAMDAGADCLIEMNKINHFIGMYPIVQGVNDYMDISENQFTFEDPMTLEKVYKLNRNIMKKQGDNTLVLTSDTVTRIHVPYPIYAADRIPDAKIPKPLKTLDKIMRSAKYIFILFAIFGLLYLLPTRKTNFLGILVALAPLYFLALYIYYLWWYGHHLGLHGGGAFSGIKPFMPTVFGEGKVAQFTTSSYPDKGFFIGLAGMLLILISMAFKNRYIKSKKQETSF